MKLGELGCFRSCVNRKQSTLEIPACFIRKHTQDQCGGSNRCQGKKQNEVDDKHTASASLLPTGMLSRNGLSESS